MKPTFLLVLIMLAGALCSALHGQVRVTGHISAEIVESADAGFEGETDFMLNFENNHKLVPLGYLNLKAGAEMHCCFSISDARLTDKNGTLFNIEPYSANHDQFMTTDAHGEQALEISAITPVLPKGGRYVGNYTVVLAYN